MRNRSMKTTFRTLANKANKKRGKTCFRYRKCIPTFYFRTDFDLLKLIFCHFQTQYTMIAILFLKKSFNIIFTKFYHYFAFFSLQFSHQVNNFSIILLQLYSPNPNLNTLHIIPTLILYIFSQHLYLLRNTIFQAILTHPRPSK